MTILAQVGIIVALGAVGYAAGRLLTWSILRLLENYSRRLCVKILYMQWRLSA